MNRRPESPLQTSYVAGLTHQLAGISKREWFLVSTLILVCVWLYFGSAQAFLDLWGSLLSEGRYVEWYSYLYYHINTLVLLGLLPLLALRLVFGMPFTDLGIMVGDWRWGTRFFLISALLGTPLVWLASSDPAFQAEYPLTKQAGESIITWSLWAGTYLIYYIGWEVYFRGVLLFGLCDRVGVSGALLFQTAVSTLVHIGKPFTEIVAAVPGGILLGAAALRSRSVVWPLLLHWYIGMAMDVFAFHRWESRAGAELLSLWP